MDASDVLGDDWVSALEAKVNEQMGERSSWDSPIDLATHIDPGYVARDHLKYLSDRLTQAVTDVENGQSRFLLVSMPPRLGKSQEASVYFPAWLLHKHADWPLMLLSHAPDLAAGWGRSIRRLVEEHSELGLTVASDAGAATEWETTKHGVVLSRSIRQSITGRGAKVMILDDVVKDFADAHSELNRQFVWDWWQANSRTRLHPPALVVVIGTRWHEDDLLGRLQSDEYDGDPSQWEVISFPAIAERLFRDPGTGRPVPEDEVPKGADWEQVPDALGREPGEPLLSPLVPDETREQALARWEDIRQAVGTYAWNALYQQRPSPAGGAIFNLDWWQYWFPGGLPTFDRATTSWDMAFKNTKDSDYVVGQLWGCAGADRYLLAQTRARLSFTETLPVVREFISAASQFFPDGVHEHLVEDKANGTAVIDTLTSEIEGMVAVNPTESKEARARAVSPTVEARNVYLPGAAEWLPLFLDEAKTFPNGRHDDQIDALTQFLLRVRATGAVTVLLPVATISRGFRRDMGGGRRMGSTASAGRRRA